MHNETTTPSLSDETRQTKKNDGADAAPGVAASSGETDAEVGDKRTFHVCLSVGVSGYVSVEASSKTEAKAMVKKMTVCLVELLTGDANCDSVELSEGDCSDYAVYEMLVGSAIDLAEVGKKRAVRRTKAGTR